MSRYIDADELLDWIKDSITMYGNTYNVDQLNMWGLFEEQIKNTPTADVKQVVRCKDCRRYKTLDCAMSYEGSGEDYWWNEPDDYCSWGERWYRE